MGEIEQDKYLRKHINLYRDEAAIKAREDRRQKKQEKQNKPKEEEMKDEKTDGEEYEENNKEMVHLEELFKDMALDDKDDEALDNDIEALLGDMENIKIKK